MAQTNMLYDILVHIPVHAMPTCDEDIVKFAQRRENLRVAKQVIRDIQASSPTKLYITKLIVGRHYFGHSFRYLSSRLGVPRSTLSDLNQQFVRHLKARREKLELL